MGDAAVGKFSCDGCGKTYAWKAELAGRRVKCKCGQALTVPAQDPAAAMYEAPPEGFDDLYAFADEKVQAMLAGRTVVKVIVVPGKLINFVVR